MLLLRSVSGKQPEFPLSADADAILGRDQEALLRLDDTTVSRRHASLKVRDGVVYLTDLGSANGSFINGSEVRGVTRVANPGDVLQFGNVIYRLVQASSAATQARNASVQGPLPDRRGDSTLMAASVAKREMAAAVEVQKTLVRAPQAAVPGYEFGQFYQPARELSGDFVIFATRATGELWTVLGDVCGKGTPSALLMSFITGATRALVHGASSPAALLEELSELVRELDLPGMFATATALVVDTRRHRCEIALAGHHPSLLRRADGTVVELCSEPGLPLGAPAADKTVAQRFALGPGEMVLMTSDGVDECEDHRGAAFGQARVSQLLRLHDQPRALVAACADALNVHRAGRDWHDDTTLVAIGRSAQVG